MDIAERLQELRKTAGYSQEQLAEMLGLSRQAVSKWESAQGKPEIDNIVKLAEIYQVSTDYILLGKKKEETVSAVEKREKRELSPEYKKAIAIIAIIGATALFTVLLIAALGLLSRFGI